MNKLIDKIKENHENSIKSIDYYLTVPEMSVLVDWIINSTSPVNFYIGGDRNVVSAVELENLLYDIHSAIFEGGDMVFVTIGNDFIGHEPKIVFASEFDKDLKELTLNHHQKLVEKRRGEGYYEIKILGITPNEFGTLYDKYREDSIKRCFILDAARLGVEEASKYYSGIEFFQESWYKELECEILEQKKKYEVLLESSNE